MMTPVKCLSMSNEANKLNVSCTRKYYIMMTVFWDVLSMASYVACSSLNDAVSAIQTTQRRLKG
jgi:hypothetical protein